MGSLAVEIGSTGDTRRRGHFRLAHSVAFWLIVAALGPLPSASAIPELAPDIDPWVGNEVVLKSLATPLRNGKQVVDIQYRYQRYRVEKASLDSILISAGNLKGWVEKDKAVPLHRAIPYFTGEIRRNPLSSELYNMRGLIWRDRRRLDKAIEDFSQAIALSPGNAWLYSNRGIAYSELKRYDEALADYSQSIRLSPAYLSAYNNRGLVWTAKKEFDRAITDYTEAIRLDPSHALPYTNRAQAYRLRGNALRLKDDEEGANADYDKAIADYDEAIRLNPKNPLAYTNRGLAHSAKKAFHEAIADYGEAIRVDPKHPMGYNNRAWIWSTCPDAKVRDGRRAIESAKLACELPGWRFSMYLDTLAAAYAEAGEFGEAMNWQAKAVELLPQESSSPAIEGYRDRLKLYKSLRPYREEKPEE